MLTALLSIFLNSTAQITLKKVSISEFSWRSLLSNPYLYVSMILYAVSIAFWILTLRKIDVSLAFPMQSIGYIFVYFLGALIFKEKISMLGLIALILIALGASLLGISKA